jgi:hypothetical protein
MRRTMNTIRVQTHDKQWMVSSASKPGYWHIVKRIDAARVQCDCTGALMHGHCYHEALILDTLAGEYGRTEAAKLLGRTAGVELLSKRA